VFPIVGLLSGASCGTPEMRGVDWRGVTNADWQDNLLKSRRLLGLCRGALPDESELKSVTTNDRVSSDVSVNCHEVLLH
jgi:hypothetical protein